MKNILAILAILPFATLTTPAAEVLVVSANSITVDGVASGAVADTIRNRPELATAIQISLVRWEAAKAAELKTAQDALAASLATRSALIAKANALFATLPIASQVIVKPLLEEATATELAKQRAALVAELAAAQAKLDALK